MYIQVIMQFFINNFRYAKEANLFTTDAKTKCRIESDIIKQEQRLCMHIDSMEDYIQATQFDPLIESLKSTKSPDSFKVSILSACSPDYILKLIKDNGIDLIMEHVFCPLICANMQWPPIEGLFEMNEKQESVHIELEAYRDYCLFEFLIIEQDVHSRNILKKQIPLAIVKQDPNIKNFDIPDRVYILAYVLTLRKQLLSINNWSQKLEWNLELDYKMIGAAQEFIIMFDEWLHTLQQIK